MEDKFETLITEIMSENAEIPNVVRISLDKTYISIKNRSKDRNKIRFRKVAAVIAIILGSVLLSIATENNVLAKINIIGISIEEFVKSNISLNDYKTIINKSVSSNGVTIKLNEVLLDDNQIIISTSFSAENDLSLKGGVSATPSIIIDGKHIPVNGSFRKEKTDADTYALFSTIDISDLKLKNNIRFKISYDEIVINNDTKINGKWNFEFTTDKDKINASTRTIPINKRFTLENGQIITIENLKLTPLSTTLNYTMAFLNGQDIRRNDITKYDVHFVVKNQNGEVINFYSGRTMTNNNYFKYRVFTEDITSINVTPYLISGNEGEKKTDYYRLLDEEAFEVKIK